MMTGAALFAAEACMGVRPGTAGAAKSAGIHLAPANDESSQVSTDEARAAFADGNPAAGLDDVTRFREDDGVAQAR